ncbi:MAG TPA: fibronectin type III-like domain-contianing protein, partial [Fimbriimonadaceae bacterium]|nr:fibronectin type III-like domain-contianing protein [Fimbriimonadaceae bacterium]
PIPQHPNTVASVSVDVQNTGKVAGDEVVQLYLRPDTSSAETPARALKAYRRVHLEPGQKETVTFDLGKYELEIWSARKIWEVEAGTYTIWVGGSSAADLKTQVALPAIP